MRFDTTPKIVKFLGRNLDKQIITLASIFLIFVSSFYLRVADNDLFARLAVGRLIAETHQIPNRDIFAFTQTKETWIDHEWLSGLIFYSVNEVGGDLGLFLLNICLGVISLCFLYRAQRANRVEGVYGPLIVLFISFQISFIWNSTVRSQVFTFFFFSYLLWALAEWRRAKVLRYIAILPLVFIFWVNAHGGFVVGLGFIFLALIAAFVTRPDKAFVLMSILVMCLGAILINPYGLNYVRFILEAVTMGRPEISEWRPTPLSLQFGIFWLFGLLVIFFALVRRYREQISLEGWLLLITSFVFACKHLRHVPFFLMTLAVYIPPVLGEFHHNLKGWGRARFDAVIGSAIAVAILIIFAGFFTLLNFAFSMRQFSLDYAGYPFRTVDWLKQNRAGGDILAHFDIGSFILYKLGPQFKVAIDGRYEEVYPKDTVDQALLAIRPGFSGFSEAFTSISPDLIILCDTTTPLEWATEFPGEWGVIYKDAFDGCEVLSQTPSKASHEIGL